MPVYCYKCDSCGKDFDVFLKLKDNKTTQNCPSCGSNETRKIITTVNFNLSGDDWPSKAYRIKEQGLKRSEKAGERMKEKMRYEPMPDMVPNYNGKVTDTWTEAKKLASNDGVDTTSYQTLVDKESSK